MITGEARSSSLLRAPSGGWPPPPPPPQWSPRPDTLRLEEGEVHVWRAHLDLEPSRIQSLMRTLTADERSRAERFHFRGDGERFIVARGLLRAILGLYLEMDPCQLRFSYSPYGKPSLAGGVEGEDALRFNLSHARSLALFAVTRGRELGVDIEYIRTDLADERIAEQFFSPREVAALRALSAKMRREAFFNCWTRKEAYIKARGEGLSLPLDQFDVSLAPGEPAALLNTLGNPQEARRWSLQKLDPGIGYVAALAVEGDNWPLRCWQWPEPPQPL